jgi:hypothetical protein
MNKTKLFAIGLFALLGTLASIGCKQKDKALARESSSPHCVNDSKGSTISEACAIEVAKTEIARREGAQPYIRFTADYDAKEANWAVMAIYEPEKPGGHLFVLVSRDGQVLDYAVGR